MKIRVEVVYALPEAQTIAEVELSQGARVVDALNALDLQQRLRLSCSASRSTRATSPPTTGCMCDTRAVTLHSLFLSAHWSRSSQALKLLIGSALRF